MYDENVLVVDKRCGRILYGIRVQTNCTQEEFGKKVGIDQPTISAYELGKHIPSKKTVLKIAKYFNLNPRQLTGQEKMVWSSL